MSKQALWSTHISGEYKLTCTFKKLDLMRKRFLSRTNNTYSYLQARCYNGHVTKSCFFDVTAQAVILLKIHDIRADLLDKAYVIESEASSLGSFPKEISFLALPPRIHRSLPCRKMGKQQRILRARGKKQRRKEGRKEYLATPILYPYC